MGRVVRTLMKVPAVRRVMVRLARAEDAIAKHEGSLGALARDLERLSADEAGHRALTAEISNEIQGTPARLASMQSSVQKVETALQEQQVRFSALNNSMTSQQTLVDTLQTQIDAWRIHVDGQRTQIDALRERIDVLGVENDNFKTLLAEVSQHLPPAQRANLEATLHGQQLQLGALNSTVHAQQMQLAALNDIVRQLTAQKEGKPTETTGVGANGGDAYRNGQPPRPIAKPYAFDQLLNRKVDRLGLDLAFNVHVPKVGGHTVNALFRQFGFRLLDLDMNTNDFFGTIREDRWFENYASPAPRDAYLLTGHMRLDHPIFRRLWMPHVVVAVLRDPIGRMISHYNFALRRPANPWHDEIASMKMSFLEYSRRTLEAVGPQYSFFDNTGQGIFARTGMATVQECFKNLQSKVSFYGLTERFDEFAVLSGYLLGRREILAIVPVNVTKEIEDPLEIPLKTALTEEERDVMAELLKDDIWFYEEAVKEYERRLGDQRLQAVFAEALPLVRSSRQAMSQLLTVRDPADANEQAFGQRQWMKTYRPNRS